MLLTGVLFATLWAAGRTTTPVLAMAHTVHRGAIVTADDLTVAHALADPALETVPADQVTEVVGMRALLDLPAGSLLTSQALNTDQVPAAGRSLVGLHLSPAQIPLTPLRPGDLVTVVNAGREGDAQSAEPQVVAAVVVGSGPAADGAHVVDVTVAASDAATVAGWVATGRAAVYLEAADSADDPQAQVS